MITVISFTQKGDTVYGTAMDDGAGYERFYGYQIVAPDVCTKEAIIEELGKQEV